MIKKLLLSILFLFNFGFVSFYEEVGSKVIRDETGEIETIVIEDQEYNVRYSYLDVLEEYYIDYYDYSEVQPVDLEEMTFEEFHDLFYEQDDLTISEFIFYLKVTIDDLEDTGSYDLCTVKYHVTSSSSSSSSGDRAWYYDTGESLPQMPNYGKFYFSNIWAGDILYESAGFGGLTGHIAIIEGKFYDSSYEVNYWRLMEAVHPGGVCRGVLDDDRFVDRKGYLLYVPSSTSTQRSQAIYFVTQQLGKPWALQPFTKPTSINHPRWQCSTLVWAAYKYVGIDIEQKGFGSGPGITPHDIRDAGTTSEYYNYKAK
jgi:hypothetical protein